MGSAFSVPLTDNGHSVALVGTHLDGDIIEEIHESQRLHPRLNSRLVRGGIALQLGSDWMRHSMGLIWWCWGSTPKA